MTPATAAIRPAAGARDTLAPLLAGTLVGALFAGRIETGALCALVALGAAAAAGARPPTRVWLVSFVSGAAFAWLLNFYLTPGRPLAGAPVVFGRAPTIEGAAAGGLLLLRLVGALAAMSGLRAAWPGERPADETARLLKPLERLRVPVAETRMMLGLALRFVPLLRAEAERIGRVQALRAAGPPRGPRAWLERRRAATVPTLVGALERAERVALALEARHYGLRPIAARAPDRARPLDPSRWAWGLAGAALAGVALFWRD